ncbi:MAG TPA: alpha/beta hydrolase [Acidimicrobiia bacterium]|nr:alpha/beta hydrolase [Acidimicrobiia bacterium]
MDLDGRAVFLHTGGVDLDPSDGVILLVHGAPDDHSVWRYQTRWLASAGYPVAAVDLPGHGRSEGPALESVTAMAEWVIRLVEELGASKVVIVGHSMGSLIATQAAADRPDLVEGIALVAPAQRMHVHPDLLAAAREQDPVAADLVVGWSHTGGDRFGAHLDPGVWKPAAARRLLEKNAAVLGVDLAACSSWDGSVATQVRCRSLVVVGGRDRMTPAREGKALAGAIAGPVVVVELAGAAHPMHYTRPEELNTILREWLEGGEFGVGGRSQLAG